MPRSAVASGRCECGCGRSTKLAPQSNTKLGWVKGQPIRFILGHSRKGRVTTPGGYAKTGLALTHVLIATKALGRPLPKGADVHHADGDSTNNRPGNLVICESRAYHCLLHVRMRVRAAGGNPNTDKMCNRCERALPLASFHRLKWNASTGRHAFCRDCTAKYDRVRKAAIANRSINNNTEAA